MFFLITGTRSTRKRIGYVADYCPVCMEIRPFVFSSYGKGDHVFFVSLGQKSTSGHLKCCTECGVELQAHLTDYAGSSKRRIDLEELITISQPGARALFAQGLETGARLRSRRLVLDQQEKTDRLLRILEFFNPLVERRYFNWSDFDKYSSPGCLGTIAIFVALFYQGCLLGSLVGWPWFKAAFATILVGLVVTLVISAFGPARFVRG